MMSEWHVMSECYNIIIYVSIYIYIKYYTSYSIELLSPSPGIIQNEPPPAPFDLHSSSIGGPISQTGARNGEVPPGANLLQF